MSKTARIQNFLLMIWVGSLLAVGYIAAPVLFNMLDRSVAGNVAGQMFAIVGTLGLVCGVLLLAAVLIRAEAKPFKQWRVWLLVSMLILVAAGKFIVQPMIAVVKARGIEEGSDNRKRFGVLHGVSSAMYGATSVMGVVLVVAGMSPGRRRVSKEELNRLS